MASSGQGGIVVQLPQNLRNIWVVQVFSISDICFTKLLLRVLEKMVMSLLHLDQILWGNVSLLIFSVCVQSLQKMSSVSLIQMMFKFWSLFMQITGCVVGFKTIWRL